jgi:hypothetical protein
MPDKDSELEHAKLKDVPSPAETFESCVNDFPWVYNRDVARLFGYNARQSQRTRAWKTVQLSHDV